MRPCALLLLLLGGPVACLPYAVGSTAQPVPPGHGRVAMTGYRIPRGVDILGDTATDRDNATFAGVDLEFRHGVSDRADVGIRIPSTSGVVVNYKHRLAGGTTPSSGAVSVMPGIGVVNWLSHGHTELTLMANAPRRLGIMAYGGARVMQVIPLEPDAAHDTPTAGGYAGFRFGDDHGGVYLELGVYHDKSALGMRKRDVIFIPSFTVDGDLLDALRDTGIFDVIGRPRRRG